MADLTDGPSVEEAEAFNERLSCIERLWPGATENMTKTFLETLQPTERVELAQSVGALADEGERLALGLVRLGSADLPNTLAIDSSEGFVAALGYSDAR